MNRLQTELQRLYALSDTQAPGAGDRGGHTRALVLELALPAGWDELSRVWQGVQAGLGLPAPAIAVSGRRAHQLWFSLAQPLPVAEALAFGQALARRYLGDVRPELITCHAQVAAGEPAPAAQPATASAEGVASGADAAQPCVAPPSERAPGQWSAFLASDLASLFAGQPWLDVAPSPLAQADLLARLQSIPAADLRRAMQQLRPPAPAATPSPAPMPAPPADPLRSDADAERLDPRRFLQQVMNDPAIDLHLRIEAAKALLPGFDETRAS